jgi:hypothetical protein
MPNTMAQLVLCELPFMKVKYYSGGQNPSQRAHFDIVMSLTHVPVAVAI